MVERLEGYARISNSTMLTQIAILAYWFLGERFTLWNILGLLLAMLGANQVMRVNNPH
jgi:drug/metabolite transporter (DMT)-like permease